MEKRYQAVVIGAGPAGMACGVTLQQAGVPHCVIDKAVFPRDKTCAGLVTGKTLRLIRTLFDGDVPESLFCAKSERVRLFRGQEMIADAPIKRPVRLVNRAEFDNALVERYRALGGTLLEGERVTIDEKNRRVLLKNGGTIAYDTLIFADGAMSLSRKLHAVDKRRLAFGVEAYLPAGLLPTDAVDLYFDYVKDGYLWVFPHGETVCAGVAGLFDRETDYRAILARFLTERGVDIGQARVVGAFLPYGTLVPQERLPDDLLLIGDAGGFTDPISGEGLYMSMQTGILAAHAVCSGHPKQAYLRSVKPLRQLVREGRRVQKLFYHPSVHPKLLSRVTGNNRAVTFYFDAQVDDYRYTYRQMTQLLRDYKRSRR